jgi:hypothetical protein
MILSGWSDHGTKTTYEESPRCTPADCDLHEAALQRQRVVMCVAEMHHSPCNVCERNSLEGIP